MSILTITYHIHSLSIATQRLMLVREFIIRLETLISLCNCCIHYTRPWSANNLRKFQLRLLIRFLIFSIGLKTLINSIWWSIIAHWSFLSCKGRYIRRFPNLQTEAACRCTILKLGYFIWAIWTISIYIHSHSFP